MVMVCITKTCMQTCKQCKKQFNIDAQYQVFYKKMNVPEPTLCPDCRRQRRFAFRNERALYSRPCDLCKKTVVSFYSVSYPGKVYCQDCWWSDAWDSKTYGRVYDPSKSFFEQFHELFLSVPQLALINTKSENAAFTAHSASIASAFTRMRSTCRFLQAGAYASSLLFRVISLRRSRISRVQKKSLLSVRSRVRVPNTCRKS